MRYGLITVGDNCDIEFTEYSCFCDARKAMEDSFNWFIKEHGIEECDDVDEVDADKGFIGGWHAHAITWNYEAMKWQIVKMETA